MFEKLNSEERQKIYLMTAGFGNYYSKTCAIFIGFLTAGTYYALFERTDRFYLESMDIVLTFCFCFLIGLSVKQNISNFSVVYYF
jgi:hypothetical protein